MLWDGEIVAAIHQPEIGCSGPIEPQPVPTATAAAPLERQRAVVSLLDHHDQRVRIQAANLEVDTGAADSRLIPCQAREAIGTK